MRRIPCTKASMHLHQCLLLLCKVWAERQQMWMMGDWCHTPSPHRSWAAGRRCPGWVRQTDMWRPPSWCAPSHSGDLGWRDTPASLGPPGLETQVFSTHIQLAQDNIYTVICNSALKLIFWPCVGINVTVSYNYPTEIQPCPALPKLSWNTAMLCFAWDFLKYNPTIAIQRYRGSAEAAVAWAYLWFSLLSLSCSPFNQ